VTRRLVLTAALSLAPAWSGAPPAAAPPPQAGPVLRFLDPTDEAILVGHVLLRVATATLPKPVAQVVYQVDGVEACRASAPPFACRYDAGTRVSSRVVRAVVTFDDGTRLSGSTRTRGVTVVETTNVESVVVPVHVTDGRGRFVPGLTVADFALTEDDVPQRIALLSAGETGAEVLVVLDISASMAPAMPDLVRVVGGFLRTLRPVDMVTVAAFNTGLFVLAGRDTDLEAKVTSLDRLRPWGSTAIYDTIIRGADLLRRQSGRRALVLFTDGDDVSSRATLEASRTALLEQDTLLYLVATGKAASSLDLRKRLTALALETGGAAFFAPRIGDTAEHFGEIVRDLSQQYVLSYAPERPLGDGKWRRIRLDVTRGRFTVRARSGYIATRRTGGG
jgi:VWFA-related protein